MLIPCVECGKKAYTEESPLWYHCNSCLHPKPKISSNCLFCGQETSNKLLCTSCIKIKEVFEHFHDTMHYCDGCGEDYPNAFLTYVDQWDGYFCNRCAE